MFLMNKENSMLIFYFDVVVDDIGVRIVDLGAVIVQYKHVCNYLQETTDFGEEQAGPDKRNIL